jgi:rod shape determining protein RodA
VRKVLLSVQRYLKNADIFLLILCLICSGFGMLLISSATLTTGTHSYLYVQGAAIILGCFSFVAMSLLDLDIITDKWKLVFLFNILFFLTLPIWGVEGDTGNRGWLRFFGIGIQPAEIVKITFTILLAKQIASLRTYGNLNAIGSVAQLGLHFIIMFGLIIVVSADLGSALVYFIIFLLMLFTAGVKLRWFAGGIAMLGAASPIVWNNFLNGNQKERILAPYFPQTIDPGGLGITWQANQSKIALASGKFFGEGLYKGTQTQSSLLPFKHTDFIFAVAGEELGMVGCVAIIILLTAVILRCVYVAVKCNDLIGMLVCTGIAGMMIFQTFENIGMCIGLMPVIGLTLPFFSSGGSSVLTTFAAMGVVSGVWLRRKPKRRNY